MSEVNETNSVNNSVQTNITTNQTQIVVNSTLEQVSHLNSTAQIPSLDANSSSSNTS